MAQRRSDFGLSCILDSAEVQIDLKQGAQQWKSPQYLRGDRPTLESDVYSLGMCILEAITGELPWGVATVGAVVRHRVSRGILPLKPERVSNSQWNLIQMMCAADSTQRVQIGFVVEKLHEFWQQP